ncbi:MAG: nuclear transport factor 2 family protein [Candidatus Heimdallarchaeota archaeon]|nr:nuclear transport factor 2 family protein [Candidatus Heimdallarchaeota archaeon]
MSKESNIKLVHTYIEEIWNNRQYDLIDTVFHPEYDNFSSQRSREEKAGVNSCMQWFTASSEDVLKHKNIGQIEFTKRLLKLYEEVIPDLKYEIRRVVADDTQVCITCVTSGTPSQKFGIFNPTMTSYEIDCSFYFEFKDGLISNILFIFDSLTSFIQTNMAKLNEDVKDMVFDYLNGLKF